MKSSGPFILSLLLTGLVAGVAGWYFGRSGAEAELGEYRAQVKTLKSQVRRIEGEADLWRDRGPVREPDSEIARASDRGPAVAVREAVESYAPREGGGGLAAAEEALPGPGPEERARRTTEIRAQFDGWFENAKGDDALAALKELATLVPEGREAAMKLAVLINQDVNGAGKLKLSQMVFYTNLGDPAMTSLFNWSLENDSPPDFRQMAVYSLPWTTPQKQTLAKFVDLLGKEQDQGVQRALVWNLSQMRKPEADAALAELVRDSTRDSVVRTQALTTLAMSKDPEVARIIEDAAYGDPDASVRRAAKATLQMRDPPATGYMVTGTVPESQAEAAGMQAGDIIVTYGGRSTETLDDLRAAAGASKDVEDVEVVVVREGQRVTLRLRPGQMGIFGREVKRK